MDIQFYGANCITLSNKQARVVIDDNLASFGGKSVAKEGDVALFTAKHTAPAASAKIVIDKPGEYEVSGVSVYGIPARAHMDEDKSKTATMYKLVFDDISVLITGHVYPELSDAQLEAIGMIDVLFVPIGGNGYTLDGIGALKLIKKIDPKLIIPTHYDDPKLNFEVPQQTLEQGLKAMAMEPKETVGKLKLKSADLAEAKGLIVLESS
ncbi:MAG TPA: MBL fold metallo-hydrolase [Candidatus Saccharimonadales bacterium]|jgi:L-ascorbate metabolism protein UlaG (beta-lactamase superfamily)|nr:MBL fold metallo-hydrolase [Candidatus Saccharimonadales bacterium]